MGMMSADAADAPTTARFMQLGEGERYWFLEGAYRTVSHLISLQDKAKGECAANWYLKDRDAKRRIVENAIAANPDRLETSIILGLLQQACGPLTPQGNR